MTTQRTMISSVARVTLFALAMGLTGCGGEQGGTTPDTATQQKPEVNPDGKVGYDINNEAPAPK